jgi:beta-1,4-mannosyl-glycoprotein beta-1,4-N-acetylglucosaminyltransferase
MIYDCFQFFNEFDILEIRLEELYPIVDKFVICESTLTHNNKPNELKLKSKLDRYSKYLDKIIYIVYDQFPDDIGYWTLESNQRKYLINGIDMENLKDNDIIMISDADEIPKRSYLKRLINNFNYNESVTISHKLFYGKVIYQVIEPSIHQNWGGTVLIPGKFFKQMPDMQYHRNLKDNWTKFTNTGSWHFSYMGTPQDVINKISSFLHSEWDRKEVLDNIENNINNIKDPLGRPEFLLKKVKIDHTYPEAIKNNPEKYTALI